MYMSMYNTRTDGRNLCQPTEHIVVPVYFHMSLLLTPGYYNPAPSMYLLRALEQQPCLISDLGVSPRGHAMMVFLNWLKTVGSMPVFPLG